MPPADVIKFLIIDIGVTAMGAVGAFLLVRAKAKSIIAQAEIAAQEAADKGITARNDAYRALINEMKDELKRQADEITTLHKTDEDYRRENLQLREDLESEKRENLELRRRVADQAKQLVDQGCKIDEQARQIIELQNENTDLKRQLAAVAKKATGELKA